MAAYFGFPVQRLSEDMPVGVPCFSFNFLLFVDVLLHYSGFQLSFFFILHIPSSFPFHELAYLLG